jgi:hypothetical protein
VAGWQAVDAGTARGWLTALRDLDWGWTPDEVPSVVDRLGWHLAGEVPGKAAVARTPFDIGRDNVSVVYRDGRVRRVSIGATDRGGLRIGLETAQRTDETFDRLMAVGTELFGPPVLRVDGDERYAHWRGEHATITVAQSTATVFIEWAPNEYEDEWLRSGTILG